MSVEDTSKRDPLLHLGGAFDDPGRYIEEMEAAGQRQLVNSTKLPTEGSEGLAVAGFTLGPVDETDPLFRDVTLPDGWRKEGSDHDMWSFVVDTLGRRRVSVFYKAAFYDRRAFCRADSVKTYVQRVVDGSQQLVLDATWATHDAVRGAVDELREYAATADSDPHGYWAKQVAGCDAVLAQLSQEQR